MPDSKYPLSDDDPSEYPGLHHRMRQLRRAFDWSEGQAYAVATQEIRPNATLSPRFLGTDQRGRPVFEFRAPHEGASVERTAIGRTGALSPVAEPIVERGLPT